MNEGFATYAEYLWSEHIGEGTADELAQYLYDSIPADHEFWQVLPGDPGADDQFHSAVYDRGALAVHALRTTVGDEVFFELLRTWLGVEEGDAELAVRMKLRARAGALLGAAGDATLPYLGLLLSVRLDPDEERELLSLSADDLAARIQDAFVTWAEALASMRPPGKYFRL